MGHRVTGLSAERARGSLVAGHGLLMAVLAHDRFVTVCSNQKVCTEDENVLGKWMPKGKQSTRMYKLVHYFFFTSLN